MALVENFRGTSLASPTGLMARKAIIVRIITMGINVLSITHTQPENP
jgi:hypothetical protein